MARSTRVRGLSDHAPALEDSRGPCWRAGTGPAHPITVAIGRRARQVWCGSLRSVAFGDRMPEDWRVNHKAHRRIRDNSPLQPADRGIEGSTDLLRRDLLEDYLFRLNRHPGRRVDTCRVKWSVPTAHRCVIFAMIRMPNPILASKAGRVATAVRH